MKKPQRVNILGTRFKVEHADLIPEGLFGDCDVDNKIIRIEQTLEGKSFKETLTHEKFHAMLRLSGISELLTEELEEALCRLVERL